MSGMGERWLTRLTGVAAGGRAAGALLALAAFGQAIGQAVTLGFANSGKWRTRRLLAFLYAVALSRARPALDGAAAATRPAGAAVVAVARQRARARLFRRRRSPGRSAR